MNPLVKTWRTKAKACDKELRDAAKADGLKTLSAERVHHYEQAAITLRACADELESQLDKGRVKGGKARWKGTTKKTRSAAASKAAKARWQKSENFKFSLP